MKVLMNLHPLYTQWYQSANMHSHVRERAWKGIEIPVSVQTSIQLWTMVWGDILSRKENEIRLKS